MAIVYVVNSSPNPDRMECRVPWALDQNEVFFGPCKKSLRQSLRKYLLGSAEEAVPPHDIFLLGVNGLHGQRRRKVVWAGRITRLMTFARAFESLRGGRYDQLHGMDNSPLHVQPEYEGGQLIGYRWRRGALHAGKWVPDLAPPNSNIRVNGDRLRFAPGRSAKSALGRDLCFLTENLHYASGAGLDIDTELLDVLRRAQPGTQGIDARAVFGKTAAGEANGKRGSYLLISDPDLVSRVASWLGRTAGPATPARSPAQAIGQRSRRCG